MSVVNTIGYLSLGCSVRHTSQCQSKLLPKCQNSMNIATFMHRSTLSFFLKFAGYNKKLFFSTKKLVGCL